MRAIAIVPLACAVLTFGCAVHELPPLTTPPGAETVWIESLGLERLP